MEEDRVDRFERFVDTVLYFCEISGYELVKIELKDIKTGEVHGITDIN